MEQHQRELQNKNHSRNASIKSPDNVRIQRNLVEESSSFKEPLYQHSRKHSDANSSRVGGTISAINERIQNLDHYLSQGTRSASKQSANLMTPNKAESSGIHHVRNFLWGKAYLFFYREFNNLFIMTKRALRI